MTKLLGQLMDVEVGPSVRNPLDDFNRRCDDLWFAFQLQALAEIFESVDCWGAVFGGDALQLNADQISGLKQVARFVIAHDGDLMCLVDGVANDKSQSSLVFAAVVCEIDGVMNRIADRAIATARGFER